MQQMEVKAGPLDHLTTDELLQIKAALEADAKPARAREIKHQTQIKVESAEAMI